MELNIQESEYLLGKQTSVKPITYKSYVQLIERIHKGTGKHLDEMDLGTYVNFIEKQKSINSKNKLIIILKNFYNEQELELGKLRKLKPIKQKTNHVEYEKKLVSYDDYRKLMTLAHKPLHKLILEIAYITGFRAGEMISIKYGDIKIKDNKIYIACSESKTEPRKIPIYDDLEIIEDYLNIYHQTKKEDDYLFLIPYNKSFQQMHQTNLNRVVKKLCEKAHIRHHTPHDFRHARATYLCTLDIKERVINKLMGWSENSNMISRYNHNQMGEYEDIIENKFHSETKTTKQYKKEIAQYELKLREQEQRYKEQEERLKRIEDILLNKQN